MARILIILTAISAAMYLLIATTSWLRRASERRKVREHVPEPYPAYFWGFAFAVVFYYGFPVWWWRYGLRNTCKLIISCVLIVAAAQAILRYAELIEVDGLGESFAASLLIAVPVRALAGFWVARNDRRWRNAIVIKRGATRGVVASDTSTSRDVT
jgi:hypothetical protein